MIRGLKIAVVAAACGVLVALAIDAFNNKAGFAGAAQVKTRPSVAKVTAIYGRFEDTGSGVLIREDLILTNEHVIEYGKKFSVLLSDGSRRSAKLIKKDAKLDLGLLKIGPVDIKPAVAAKEPAKRGDIITICGFPLSRAYKEVTGKLSGWRSLDKAGKNKVFLVNRTVRSGTSGGPAFNENGELVGIVFGSNVYSNCGDIQVIKKFLEDVK